MRRAVSILEIKAGLSARALFSALPLDGSEQSLGMFEHLVILAEIGAARRQYAEELSELVDLGGEGG